MPRIFKYCAAQNSALTGNNSYTGLGGRYVLHDSTGGRWLYTDGQSATSPRIYDDAKYYNPGLGEYSAQYGQYYDYDTDDLGSVVGLLGSSETEAEGYADDAFGNSILTFGSNSFTVGQIDLFAAGSGYETDNDTGLIRTGNRYYNPYFGRYMTEDPAEVGDNWYSYCGNDATDYLDPMGENKFTDLLKKIWQEIVQAFGGGPTVSGTSGGTFTETETKTTTTTTTTYPNGTKTTTSSSGTVKTFQQTNYPSGSVGLLRARRQLMALFRPEANGGV